MTLKWHCSYGSYHASTEDFSYVVFRDFDHPHIWLSQMRDLSEGVMTLCGHPMYHPVPGPLALSRREAQRKAEEHAESRVDALSADYPQP